MNGAGWTRRRFLHGALFASVGWGTSGCRGPKSGSHSRRGPIRFPLVVDPFPLDYRQVTSSTPTQIAHLLSDSLVWWDKDLKPVPRLARSWAWSADGRTLVFELRENGRWQDGAPITAADAAHTFRILSDPRQAHPERVADFQEVEDWDAPSRFTLRVHYRRPSAPALFSQGTLPLLPAHRAQDPQQPLSCGPFRVERWEPNQRLSLAPNTDYFEGPPHSPGLQFEIIPDYEARFSALIAGQLEMAPVLAKHFRSIESNPDLKARLKVLEYRVLFYWFIAWRMDGSNPFFADSKVRLALTLALDRERFISQIASSPGEVAASSFHPDQWAHDPELRPWPFDPQHAEHLLDQAGWVRSRPDAIRSRNGRPFEFDLLFPARPGEWGLAAQFFQSNLKDIGVSVRLEPLEFQVFNQRVQTRDYQALLWAHALSADPNPFELWHSSQAAGGANFSGLNDSDIDRWIEEGREKLDPASRTVPYRHIAHRLHELQPCTFLLFPLSRLAVSREIANVGASPQGVLFFWPGAWAWQRAG